jgi:16S rRNA (cytosine1402-N4)-methyltransferase
MMADEGGNPMGTGCSCGPGHRHIPVLLTEVLASLRPEEGEIIIDGTFGAGGYTRAILNAADCRVIALDRDPEAIRDGFPLTVEYKPRLTLARMRFGELDRAPMPAGCARADGVVLDIGVSSMQIDQAERGFSFQADGPLDMRMFASEQCNEQQGRSAADLVNTLPEAKLADVIYHYGEERRSRAIAAAIVRARQEAPLTRTHQLAQICTRVYGRRPKDGIHPATRTFQALRIAVNDELGELAHGLAAAERILKPGGRLVVVTFHSLEDRIVKRFFSDRSGRRQGRSRHFPELTQFEAPSFQNVNHRPLVPDNQEIAANPRARSAKLRAGVRTEAPSRPLELSALGLPDLDID